MTAQSQAKQTWGQDLLGVSSLSIPHLPLSYLPCYWIRGALGRVCGSEHTSNHCQAGGSEQILGCTSVPAISSLCDLRQDLQFSGPELECI